MHLKAISTDGDVIGDIRAAALTSFGPADFAGLMAACAPFETRPHLAVGVSGGPDSLALMLLLADWVKARGGSLTALTVDHGLRAEAAMEAVQVSLWAELAGVAHRTLTWSGTKPHTGIQAAARQARYDLLTSWCRAAGVLHLATAHHLDDQRETVAMRLARGTGAGNAGMSLITARNGVRLIRPLLPVAGDSLKSYLRARGQDWFDDPSNDAERFERVRWRRGLEGPLPASEDIQAWGEARQAREARVADLLARSVSLHPSGFALIDLSPWRRVGEEILPQALGQVVAMVAGSDYLPARGALTRAAEGLLASARMLTLGGTRIGTWRGQGLICREAAAVTDEIEVGGPARYRWDRRFDIEVAAGGMPAWVAALGAKGLGEIAAAGLFRVIGRDIPAPARASLPALRDATGRLIAVPHLGFDPYGEGSRTHFRFLPHNSATSSGFTVAYAWPHTI